MYVNCVISFLDKACLMHYISYTYLLLKLLFIEHSLFKNSDLNVFNYLLHIAGVLATHRIEAEALGEKHKYSQIALNINLISIEYQAIYNIKLFYI